MLGKAMTATEQEEHNQIVSVVQSAVSALRLTRCQDEDVRVALARLENWQAENEGRWVK